MHHAAIDDPNVMPKGFWLFSETPVSDIAPLSDFSGSDSRRLYPSGASAPAERSGTVLVPDLICRNLRQTLRIESRHHLLGEEFEVPPGFFGIKRSVEKPKIEVITTVVSIMLELLNNRVNAADDSLVLKPLGMSRPGNFLGKIAMVIPKLAH